MIIARGGVVKSLVPSWACRDGGGGGFPEIMRGTSWLVWVVL